MRRSIATGLGFVLLTLLATGARAEDENALPTLVPYSSPSQLPKGCDDLRPPHETPAACRAHLNDLANSLKPNSSFTIRVTRAEQDLLASAPKATNLESLLAEMEELKRQGSLSPQQTEVLQRRSATIRYFLRTGFLQRTSYGTINGEIVVNQAERSFQVELAWRDKFDTNDPSRIRLAATWSDPKNQRLGNKQVTNNHLCGGVLVSPFWILTAAHCVTQEGSTSKVVDKDQLIIHAGAPRLSDASGSHINGELLSFRIKAIYPHENYRPSQFHQPPENDVALVQLTEAVPCDNPLKFHWIGYVTPEPAPGAIVSASGWGAVNQVTTQEEWRRTFSDPQQLAAMSIIPMSRDLSRITIQVLPEKDCLDGINRQLDVARSAYSNQSFPYLAHLPPDSFCAGNPPGARKVQATCQGDSGGPIMAEETAFEWKERFRKTSVTVDDPAATASIYQTSTAKAQSSLRPTILVGLVGWSVGCGVAPTVFTRVADHYAWIQKRITTAVPTP